MMKKVLKMLLLLLLLAVIAGVSFFMYARHKYFERFELQNAVEVMVPKGSGLNRVSKILDESGVIDDARWLILFAHALKLQNEFKAGEYAFSGITSYQEILNKLVRGEVIVRSLTIPEGKALVEIKKIIEENPYLTGEITVHPEEGEILPETYHFVRGEQRNALIQRARRMMEKTLSEVYAQRDAGLPLKSARELLVLASIVEKETGITGERAKVASVFVNRLRLGMKLQTDPTVIYAVTHGEMNLERPIYKRDLAYDSPYNTYVYAGLPPAPICSPGKAALLAVAHPDDTPYLYFVADGETGGHRFAKTLNEHNGNVAHYRNNQ